MSHLNATDRTHPAILHDRGHSLTRKQKPELWRGLTTIEGGQPARFVCPADVEVTCVSGIAWITIAADTRDIVLEPGQRHEAFRHQRLFINAMPRCILRIEPLAR